jgi:hypothetical protein
MSILVMDHKPNGTLYAAGPEDWQRFAKHCEMPAGDIRRILSIQGHHSGVFRTFVDPGQPQGCGRLFLENAGYVDCEPCDGTGNLSRFPADRCKHCNGTGFVDSRTVKAV